MLFLLFTILLFVLYSVLLLRFWQSWKQLAVFVPTHTAGTRISVIIPARNEENNIGALLQALQQQNYPASVTEIIVVDDHSTDQTAAIVRSFAGITLVQLKEEGINSYKKKAIEKGIAAATGELIITTDADCLPGPEWLSRMAAFYEEKQAAFVAAPVVFTNDHSLLQVFQALDFLVLQGITAAGVSSGSLSMCNGANMAYTKAAFHAVNGFKGIDQLASGDDMLLMHKISTAFPGKTHYLFAKEAIMTTAPMQSWKAFFNQRIRWASKARTYSDKRIIAVLLLVYLFNLSFVGLFVAGFYNSDYWLLLLATWVAKTLVELPFVSGVARFFDKQSLLKFFFFFQPLHILYTVLSGLLGQFGTYEWKGRNVK
jgi:cellulose synthase/poly-beta-1,6-N-acetylglucosamine synthase-like glycosyltransferase